MKIVIAGAGEVGYNLIEKLAREGMDLSVVDTDAKTLKSIEKRFKVAVDLSNVVDSRFLSKSHLKDADLFLAITNSDETNMIACKMAKASGVSKTVCRIRSVHLEGSKREESLKSLGIDFIINPVELVAAELFQLVMTPNLIDQHQFDDGKLLFLGYRMQPFCSFMGKSFGEVRNQLERLRVVPALLLRHDRCFLPHDETLVEPNDVVYFFSPNQAHNLLREQMGYARAAMRKKRIMINGGGHIGFRLARLLEDTPHQVKIIEMREQRAQSIAGRLRKALVLNFDGTELKKLVAEGLDEMDFFISVASKEEINIAACLLAKAHCDAKTICLVKQQELIPILQQGTQIERAISPRILTARHLNRFIQGGDVESYFSQAHMEVFQLHLKAGSPVLGRSIEQMDLGEASSVGLIHRGGHYVLPRPKTILKEDDLLFLMIHKLDRAQVMARFESTVEA
ncbi:MAG: Trk system potassium transporter TrkA [bacterium]|nr:Trk system potassium transporter TrkA [bacterium]